MIASFLFGLTRTYRRHAAICQAAAHLEILEWWNNGILVFTAFHSSIIPSFPPDFRRRLQHETQKSRCNQCAAKNGKGETVAVCNVKQKSEERRSQSGHHLGDQQAQPAHSTEGAPTEIICPQDFRKNHVAPETHAV